MAARMKESFDTSGKFIEDIVFGNGLQLQIEMKSDIDKHTRLERDGDKFILTTNPDELKQLAKKIKELLSDTDIGDSLVVAEYSCNDAILRVVAEQS